MTHSYIITFFGLAPFGSVKHNTSILVCCARCYLFRYTITLSVRNSLLFILAILHNTPVLYS